VPPPPRTLSTSPGRLASGSTSNPEEEILVSQGVTESNMMQASYDSPVVGRRSSVDSSSVFGRRSSVVVLVASFVVLVSSFVSVSPFELSSPGWVSAFCVLPAPPAPFARFFSVGCSPAPRRSRCCFRWSVFPRCFLFFFLLLLSLLHRPARRSGG
jgi:hypothetical protein